MRSIAKKLLSALLALALVCGLAAAAGAESETDAKKLVLLGDSIPAGEGASDPSKSYAKLLAAQGCDVANFAVGGHKADDLLAVLAENEDARTAIGRADFIGVSIGGNDLLASNVITLVLRLLARKDTRTLDKYIEAFREKFTRIVSELRELNGDAVLIAQTLYNSMEDVPLVGSAYNIAVAKLNQVYYDYLAEHPGAYVIADVYGAFKGRGGLIHPDRLHPSDEGHAMIARVLTAAMEGRRLALEPVDTAQPNFFRRIIIFFRALVNYMRYWLTQMSPWAMLKKTVSLIF